MRDIKVIRRRAAKVVENANGPLGPLPIERVVRTHFLFFQELRAAGISWSQISDLLRDAGLRTRRNVLLNENVLRASFARASRGLTHSRSSDHQDIKRTSDTEATRARRAQSIGDDIQSSDISIDITARMNRAASIRGGHGGE